MGGVFPVVVVLPDQLVAVQAVDGENDHDEEVGGEQQGVKGEELPVVEVLEGMVAVMGAEVMAEVVFNKEEGEGLGAGQERFGGRCEEHEGTGAGTGDSGKPVAGSEGSGFARLGTGEPEKPFALGANPRSPTAGTWGTRRLDGVRFSRSKERSRFARTPSPQLQGLGALGGLAGFGFRRSEERSRWARIPSPQQQGHGAPGACRRSAFGRAVALGANPRSPTAGTWGTRL